MLCTMLKPTVLSSCSEQTSNRTCGFKKINWSGKYLIHRALQHARLGSFESKDMGSNFQDYIGCHFHHKASLQLSPAFAQIPPSVH